MKIAWSAASQGPAREGRAFLLGHPGRRAGCRRSTRPGPLTSENRA